MAAWSARQKLLFALAFWFGLVTVKLLGDQYLRPLPTWLKLVLVAAGLSLIAALAVYSRRRARRLAARTQA